MIDTRHMVFIAVIPSVSTIRHSKTDSILTDYVLISDRARKRVMGKIQERKAMGKVPLNRVVRNCTRSATNALMHNHLLFGLTE